MDAALVIGFYAAVVVLALKVRRFNLALVAMGLTVLLVVALVLQATVSDRIAGWAALLLTSGVVMFGLAVRLAGWMVGGDEASDADLDVG